MYLVCPHHDEPVQAERESGQHHYDLPTIRFNYLRRDHWLNYIERFPGTLTRGYDHLSYFERATFTFLGEHRDCALPYIQSEYGERFHIDVENLDDLLTLDGFCSDTSPNHSEGSHDDQVHSA